MSNHKYSEPVKKRIDLGIWSFLQESTLSKDPLNRNKAVIHFRQVEKFVLKSDGSGTNGDNLSFAKLFTDGTVFIENIII